MADDSIAKGTEEPETSHFAKKSAPQNDGAGKVLKYRLEGLQPLGKLHHQNKG